MEKLVKSLNQLAGSINQLEQEYEDNYNELMEAKRKGSPVSLDYIEDARKNNEEKIYEYVHGRAKEILFSIPTVASKEINKIESNLIPVTADSVAEIDALFSLEEISQKDIEDIVNKYKFNDILSSKIQSSISKYNKNIIGRNSHSGLIMGTSIESKALLFNGLMESIKSYLMQFTESGTYKVKDGYYFSKLSLIESKFKKYQATEYNAIKFNEIDKSYTDKESLKESLKTMKTFRDVLFKRGYR